MSKKNKVKNDFVRTPREVTNSLLNHERFNGNILEPCCGDGFIADVLSSRGHTVIASDKYSYGYGAEKNLFDISEQYDNIITNPPFTEQQKVKKHLLSITKQKLALLWYVKNIGNEIETKTSKHLKTVYVLNKRVPWVEVKLGWLFAWYIWDKNHIGDVTIKRIDF